MDSMLAVSKVTDASVDPALSVDVDILIHMAKELEYRVLGRGHWRKAEEIFSEDESRPNS